MTDVLLWAFFVALLTAALTFAWPRQPGWDPVTFHHLVLATLVRGEVEASGADRGAWRARLDLLLPTGPTAPGGGWTLDPDELGADYATEERLGAGVTWDAVAAGAPCVAEVVTRRLEDVRLIWFGAAPLDIPGVVTLAAEGVTLQTMTGPGIRASTRFVLATREHGAALLTALRNAPDRRDRIRALLFVDAQFDPAAEVRQDDFDTELDRTTPWFVLRSREGDDTRLAEPPVPETQRRSIRVHDLGRVPGASLSEPLLARSLAILLAAAG
ncbi:MAG: hypothetical protein EXR71_10185 [Myxococcales bacterium]|nr:hypothetical protein [Myxococcales bacterium]